MAATLAQDLRIEHVTVVSPERAQALVDAEVTVHAGRIAAISPAEAATPAPSDRQHSQVIDGRGLYLIPGLIDSHVHLYSIPGMTDEQERAHPDIARAAREQFPRSYLYFGFTTLIDLISSPAAMARWKSHEPLPDTYFCGGAPLLDGYPMNYLPKAERYTDIPYWLFEPQAGAPLPAGVDAAAHSPHAVVAQMKADGAICVKTFFERGFGGAHDLPVPHPETIRALVRAAHALELPVLLHANSAEAQTFGLDTGVDILAHGLWNADEKSAPGELTTRVKAILDRIIATHTGDQPTLQVLYGLQNLFNPGFLADPMLAQVLPRSLIDWYGTREGQWFHDTVLADLANSAPNIPRATLRPNFAIGMGRVAAGTGYLARHGARLLFGTDTPSAPTYANPPGLNGWMEMHRLVDAGVTPDQIFVAATLSDAQAFHLDGEIGTVQVGKRANLLLVRADPRQTLDAYASIVKVILGGRVLDRKELSANRSH
jgi:imidazolonepropionase-like amidohydrolase